MSIATGNYSVTAAQERFNKRDVIRYSHASGNPVHWEMLSTPKAGFNPAGKFDGQSLAGTGALVFEGELLELPR